ncbi:MAG: 4-alpha-glucanotransferase, partial [Spartobacteria bacterium]
MTSTGPTLSPEQKIGGILTPVSAIRGANDVGIGDTETLVELAAWASRAGFRLVQILPVNETGSDHSPYNIISSLAYEPVTLSVSPHWLPDVSAKDFARVTKKHDVAALREGPVRYGAVKALKRELLELGHKNFRSAKGNKARVREFEKFQSVESEWLEPYALFRALIAWNNNDEVTSNWPEEHRTPAAAREWLAALDDKQAEL